MTWKDAIKIACAVLRGEQMLTDREALDVRNALFDLGNHADEIEALFKAIRWGGNL